ncbi:transposase [Ruminococcus albus]
MLKKIYYNKYIWNPSYFVATVSDRSLKHVTDYINSQKNK